MTGAKSSRGGRPPTPGEIWAERYDRALDAHDTGMNRLRSEFARELLRVRGAGTSRVELVDGRWVDNPHFGDEDWERAEWRRVWSEFGEQLGIGPPPEDFFGPRDG